MRWSISIKIISLNIVVALLVTSIVTWTSIRQVTQQVDENLDHTGQNVLQSIQERIRSDVEQSQRFAELLAGHQELHQLLKDEEIGLIQEWLNNQSEIEIYALVEVFDTQRHRIAVNRWLNKKQEDVAAYLTPPNAESVVKALNYLVTVELIALPVGLTIKSVVPIVDWETTNILGTLVVSFPMNQDWVDRIRGRADYHLTIATQTNPIVASTLVTSDGKRLTRLPETLQNSLRQPDSASHLNQVEVADFSFSTFFAPIYDLRSIPQGHLVVWLPRDLIEATRAEILNILWIAALLTIVGCLLLSTILAQTMTRPLRSLVKTVELTAAGHKKQKISATSNDEIGDLAHAIAMMQNDLKISHDLVHKMLETFQLFVPSQFLRHIAHDGIDNVRLGNAQQEHASVLFMDIRSFTTFTEKLTPQQVLDFLNQLFYEIGSAVERQGFIDKFIGDAIMAIFEEELDPVGRKAGAFPAVRAGVDMLKALQKFNTNVKNPVQIGIGINTGPIIVGTLGSSTRMDSTVLGNTVNLASRVEGLTKQYNATLMITETTLENLPSGHSFLIRTVDKVRVKGKVEAVTVYEVFDADDPWLQEKKSQTLEEFHQALVYYQSKQWKKAIELLRACQAQFPEDTLLEIYLERCQTFLETPPPENWDGVYTMKTK